MTDRPIFDPNHPADWPTDEHGNALSREEVTVAIYELVKRGLVELRIDERGRIWVKATADGRAAYRLEEVFGFTDDDPLAKFDPPMRP